MTAEKEPKPYENTSIFQGLIQFKTGDGTEIRVEKKDVGLSPYFVWDGSAFILRGHVPSRLVNPRAIWDHIMGQP